MQSAVTTASCACLLPILVPLSHHSSVPRLQRRRAWNFMIPVLRPGVKRNRPHPFWLAPRATGIIADAPRDLWPSVCGVPLESCVSIHTIIRLERHGGRGGGDSIMNIMIKICASFRRGGLYERVLIGTIDMIGWLLGRAV